MKRILLYVFLAIALSAMLVCCAPYYYYPNDYEGLYYSPSSPEYDYQNYYSAYPYRYAYPYKFYFYYNYDIPTYSYDYPSSRYFNYRPY